VSYSGTRSDEGGVSDSTSKLAMLRIAGDEAQYPLSWSLDASRNVTDFSAGRETEDDQLEGTVGWALTRELQVALIAGREANNYVSLAKEAHDTYGARVSWAPSERTSALAQVKRRFFGNSHILNVSYSTARTSLLLSDTRDVVTAPAQQGIGALGRAYDLFYTQFASIEPDPVLRQLRVLQFLAVYGIDPNRIVLSPFLASAATLERQQQLSFAWRWVRDTFVLTAARSHSSRLETIATPLDDFSQSSVIRQNALTFSVAHRLTPLSSAGLDLSWQKVLGELQSSTLKSASLTWSAQASSRSSVAASLRHSRFTGLQSSYDETAVSATYSLRF
jgi:uncharacterized protein (PEP-CTERM system associated)